MKSKSTRMPRSVEMAKGEGRVQRPVLKFQRKMLGLEMEIEGKCERETRSQK